MLLAYMSGDDWSHKKIIKYWGVKCFMYLFIDWLIDFIIILFSLLYTHLSLLAMLTSIQDSLFSLDFFYSFLPNLFSFYFLWLAAASLSYYTTGTQSSFCLIFPASLNTKY